MILTQAQIENETRSKWGGETNLISQALLRRSLADFETFLNSAAAAVPVWMQTARPIAKEYILQPVAKPRPYCHHECTDHEHEKAFSPQMISSLERRFRDMFGNSAAVDLLNMAERWVTACFTSEAVGRNGYWGSAYFQMVDFRLRAVYDQTRSAWDNLSKKKRARIAPPIQIAVDDGTEFMQDIYNNGYQRVTSKITKLHLSQVRQIMIEGMSNGKTAAEIAADLNGLGGAESYHWTRLVRSEMINANQQAAIEEAKASEDVNIMWLTSISKTTCSICLERNRMVFDPHKMDGIAYFSTAETAAIEAKQKTKIPIGRFPHPNCRCSLTPTYQPADWEQRKQQPLKPIEPPAPVAPVAPPKPTPKPKPVPRPAPVPVVPVADPSKPVGPAGTGTGKAKFKGKHRMTPEEFKEFKKHVNDKIKEFGINDDIEFELWVNDKNSNNGTSDIRSKGKLSRNVSVRDRMSTTDRQSNLDLMKGTATHELTHVTQNNSQRLNTTDTHFVWEGKDYISIADYNRTREIMRNSPSFEERKAAFERYQAYPWEVEARMNAGQ